LITLTIEVFTSLKVSYVWGGRRGHLTWFHKIRFMLCYVMKRMARYVMNGLWSKRRQAKTAKVKTATPKRRHTKTATNENGECQNGDRTWPSTQHTGDFNIHLDNPTDHLTSQFLSPLSSFNLTQHVNFPTHNKITFSTWSSPPLTAHLSHPSLPPTALHLILSLFSPDFLLILYLFLLQHCIPSACCTP